MRYGSVCSGIEAATAAWHPLGWEPVWFSEIEPFPCKVLKYHYPDVPNLGDMLKLRDNEAFKESTIDLLVGGTPCQSFSIAGLRGGLADSRGNLALEFCRILAAKRPKWFVWENVPGVFSSQSGRDFASILQGFRECRYSCAWRVLDAKYYGVPQRRRRVFVVGYLGDDWRPPAAVLFEPQSLRGHTPEGTKERQEIAGTVDASTSRSRGAGTNPGTVTIGPLTTRPYADNESHEEKLIVAKLLSSYGRLQGASAQDANHGHSHLLAHSLRAAGHDASEDGTGRGTPLIVQATPINTQVATRGENMGEGTGMGIGEPGDPAYTLQQAHSHAVFMAGQGADAGSIAYSEDISPTLRTGNSGTNRTPTAHIGTSVRRLTPLECERLQGFPDGYTGIPGAKDSPRYSAIGNSMAVPCMSWIGRRIDHVNKQMT